MKSFKFFFVIFILTIASLSSGPDCLKTGSTGKCILCNHGKVAVNGICTDSILHCI
jgi:hypothetical protein